jgi:hypothetical protein
MNQERLAFAGSKAKSLVKMPISCRFNERRADWINSRGVTASVRHGSSQKNSVPININIRKLMGWPIGQMLLRRAIWAEDVCNTLANTNT